VTEPERLRKGGGGLLEQVGRHLARLFSVRQYRIAYVPPERLWSILKSLRQVGRSISHGDPKMHTCERAQLLAVLALVGNRAEGASESPQVDCLVARSLERLEAAIRSR
jgi:hypothetical protein